MKKIYNKIAPVLSKISIGGLMLTLIGLVVSAFLMKTLEDPWQLYYAAVANLICTNGVVVFAVLQVVFNFRKLWPAVREMLRKAMVSLKRNPKMIPLAVLFAAFLLYSLNLTDMSNTTAKLQLQGMGLCQFCIMLFSMLAMLCVLNAFPRRKKANIPMGVLVFAMFGILVFCDIHYMNAIATAVNRPNTLKLDGDDKYILDAFNMLSTYQILIFVTAALVALLPVYSKLLRKIKTSVNVEDNGQMDAIEISE